MKILKYSLYVFLIIIGIVIGLIVTHYHRFQTAEAINLIDLATLVTTIFLAVYIPEVLDRQLQVQKDKKDLIEKRIEELQAFYRRINLLVQQESKSMKDNMSIRNTLDLCQYRLDTITTLLDFAKMKTSFENEIIEINDLCTQHRNLLSTSKLTTEEGFVYPDDIQEQEEVLYNKIDKATCLLVFKISEA
ncbi:MULTISPECIES: hypothetical protein [unclassified Dysgonomonas]|uniref:hypothetical protein n=1 Tax=unclassified Dysgonomonas TaxID=2630389 RepID=UPI0013EA3FAA|nr:MULTISPECIES: hypothetical protein [unclassified Dysgonomonas]